jgi:hypothetical protein
LFVTCGVSLFSLSRCPLVCQVASALLPFQGSSQLKEILLRQAFNRNTSPWTGAGWKVGFLMGKIHSYFSTLLGH